MLSVQCALRVLTQSNRKHFRLYYAFDSIQFNSEIYTMMVCQPQEPVYGANTLVSEIYTKCMCCVIQIIRVFALTRSPACWPVHSAVHLLLAAR